MPKLPTDLLTPNQVLKCGDYLPSKGGNYYAAVLPDGQFCIYAGGSPNTCRGLSWSSNNVGQLKDGSYALIMQSDGNLCVYESYSDTGHGGLIWQSQTASDTSFAAMQDDGNFCIYWGDGLSSQGGFRWGTLQNGGKTSSFGPLQPAAHTIAPSMSTTITVNGICSGLFVAGYEMANGVDNTTGQGDWRYFGHISKLCLKQPTADAALDLFIKWAMGINPNEDTGQWIDHIQKNCKQVAGASTTLEKLNGVLKGFAELDGGAHNCDKWGVLKGFSNYLLTLTASMPSIPVKTTPDLSIFNLESATVALMASLKFIAGTAAGGSQTGAGDWSAFESCADSALAENSADASLNTFISMVAGLTPNEDDGQWTDHIQESCKQVAGASTQKKYAGVMKGFVELDEGAHNLSQWSRLRNFASTMLQFHFNVVLMDDRNIEMHDVESAFRRLSKTYSRCYYSINSGPVSLAADATSHFKGISSYGGKLIFTHSNVGIDEGVGKRVVAYEPTFTQDITAGDPQDTQPGNLHHPCSSQACGRYMAMGIQTSEGDLTASQIQIQDLSGIIFNDPIVDNTAWTIDWPGGINGVALGKESGPDGKYILAGIQGNTLRFYSSASPTMVDTNGKLTTFTKIWDTESFAESGCGLALITQSDGTMYLVTIDGDTVGRKMNQVSLYRIERNGNQVINGVTPLLNPIDLSGFVDTSQPVAELAVAGVAAALGSLGAIGTLVSLGALVLDTSFRWGKGLEVTSPDSFRVFGSDRNSIPFSQLNMGFTKDFSVCVWASELPN